jgi:tRNA 2-thiouridine synthesizing protein E
MPVVKYAKGTVELDDEGYLVRLDDWNEEVACVLAEREAVEELTEDRMEIIKFLRDYYKQFNHFPVLSGVCRNVHQEKECMQHRFIDPLKAWKIAGLPKPSPQVIGYLHGEGGVV